MEKRPISRGKPPLLFAALLFLAAAGAAFLIVLLAEDLYWREPHLEGVLPALSEYQEQGLEDSSGLDETKAIVHSCNEVAVPMGAELTPFFEGCDRMIAAYFQDVHGIDVAPRLDALQIMEASYPEEVSQMVGGSYSGDLPDELFINGDVAAELLSDSKDGKLPEVSGVVFSAKMLRTVYIHEVMHYLGFNSDTGFDHLMEAVSEALSKEVMEHSGLKYESITGYASIQGPATQLLDCDPAFVREVLTGERPDMAAFFNGRLGGASGPDYADCYDSLLALLQKGEKGRVAYDTQYLTYEYCKAANSGAREVLKGSGEKGVMMFEVRWLLGIG